MLAGQRASQGWLGWLPCSVLPHLHPTPAAARPLALQNVTTGGQRRLDVLAWSVLKDDASTGSVALDDATSRWVALPASRGFVAPAVCVRQAHRCRLAMLGKPLGQA